MLGYTRGVLLDRVLRGFAVVLTAGAGLGLGLGLLGGAVWWLDLFAHFRLQAVAGLLLALLLAAAARAWRVAAVAGVLVIVGLALLAPYAVPGDRSGAGPPLRLAHLNLLSSNDRHAEVVAWIERSGADLVLLQEVSPRWAAVLAATPGHRVLAELPRGDNFGLAALVREGSPVVVTAIDTLEFAGLPALSLQLQHDGRSVALLDIHTLPPMSGPHAARRDAGLVAAGAWATAQREAGAAPVVLGDLNATPFSAGVAPLAAAGLADSLTAGGLWTAGSWPALPWPLRIAIDHCWHDRRLVTLERIVGPELGSDHRPLQVALAWAP